MSEQIIEIQENELPKNAHNFWLKAISAFELKNYNYAISLCQAVLKESPGYVDGRRLARRCAIKEVGVKKKSRFGSTSTSKIQGQIKKNLGEGLQAIEKGLEKDPANVALNELLFDTGVQNNMPETATFALETIRKWAPEPHLLHKLAEYYLARDLAQEAVGVYQDIIKQNPADIDAVKGEKDATARASMKSGGWESGSMDESKKDSAGEMEQEAADKAGMTTEQKQAKLGKLIGLYNQDQNNLGVVKEIAELYEELEEWSNSHTFFAWAYQLSHKDATLKMKSEKMNNKVVDEEIKALEAQLEADPSNTELEAQILARKQERSKESVIEAQARVDQNPTDPQLRFDLGLSLYNSGDFNGAIPHLQQAKRNPHIRTRVLLTLGRSFDAKGMFDIAISQLEEALEELSAMDGTKKEVLYEMGLIHTKMDSKDGALACFKQIYEVDYGYRDVAERVEQAYSK